MEVRNYRFDDGTWGRTIFYWDLECLADLAKEYVKKGCWVELMPGDCSDNHILNIGNIR